jgi:hypothetical protein
MAVAYKSAGAGVSTETSGAALSPACPATVDAGDILILQTAWEGTTSAPSPPGDWTLLRGPENVGTAPAARHWVYGKVAAGTEDGATVALGSPAVTTQRAARIYSFSGRVSGAIADLVTGFNVPTPDDADPNGPSVTTTAAGALACALTYQNDNNTLEVFASPTGGTWAEQATAGGYIFALNPGGVLHLQTSTPTADPGTISGGAMTVLNDPWSVIGFQILAVGAVAHSETPADTIAGTDANAKRVTTTRADTVAGTDAFSRVFDAERTQADSAALTDASTRRVTRTTAESLAVTDAIQTSIYTAHTQQIDDSISGTDAVGKKPGKVQADTASATDATSRAWAALVSAADSIAATDAQAKRPTKAVADTAAGTDAITRAWAAVKAVVDSGAVTDAIAKAARPVKADTIAGTDAQARAWVVARAIADSGALTDARAKAAGLVRSDSLAGVDAVDPELGQSGSNLTHSVNDSVAATDAAVRVVVLARSESLAVTDSFDSDGFSFGGGSTWTYNGGAAFTYQADDSDWDYSGTANRTFTYNGG